MKKYSLKDVRTHKFGSTFIKENSKYLFIGTFPTLDSNVTFEFFYSSGKNIFWKVLSQIFPNSKTKLTLQVSVKDSKEVKEKNKQQRQDFCKENGIALADMISSCIRINENSKDKDILINKYNTIIDVVKNHPKIERIILTSKSAGSSAHHHFYQYLLMNEMEFEIDFSEKMYVGQIKLDRIIPVYSIDSTSLQNSHTSEKELVQLYSKALGI